MNGRKLIPGKPLPPWEIPDYSIGRDTLEEEFANPFRERLRRIAQIVRHSGEPLEGNIFYPDGDEGYAERPPAAELAPARRNVWRAVRFKERLLEVGVNAGHSALLALSSSPRLPPITRFVSGRMSGGTTPGAWNSPVGWDSWSFGGSG